MLKPICFTAGDDDVGDCRASGKVMVTGAQVHTFLNDNFQRISSACGHGYNVYERVGDNGHRYFMFHSSSDNAWYIASENECAVGSGPSTRYARVYSDSLHPDEIEGDWFENDENGYVKSDDMEVVCGELNQGCVQQRDC